MTSTLTATDFDVNAKPPSKRAYEIADAIRRSHQRANMTKSDLLEQIAEFDASDLAYSFGAVSTASWLARELHYPVPTAYEYVRVARKPQEFPMLKTAFSYGELDYTTVRLLLRYINERNERGLLVLAKELTFTELRRVLAGVEPEDKDDDEKPDEPYLNAHTRDDGMIAGSFLLPPVEGEKFKAALKIAELAAYGAQEGDETEPPEEACPAEMVDEPRPDPGMGAEKILRAPSRFGAPLKSAMYDAFVTMIDMVRTNPVSPLRAPGAHVNIMCTTDGRAWMPSNPQAPSSAIRQYLHNALGRWHIMDGKGLTLNMGRQQRFATDAQVTALLAQWEYQCAMPGCNHSRFMEIHHIHEWVDGGSTDIDNLIPLCSSCHSKVSHGLAHIANNSGYIEFRFLDGSRYVAEGRSLPKRVEDFDGPMILDPDEVTFG